MSYIIELVTAFSFICYMAVLIRVFEVSPIFCALSMYIFTSILCLVLLFPFLFLLG